MDIFYRYNKKYNLQDFKFQLQNVKLIELFKDEFCIEQKPKSLKYFKEPKLPSYPLNLNEGYDQHRFRNIDVFYGNNLSKSLSWDIKQGSTNSKQNEGEPISIYTHRHAIVKIIQSHSNRYGSIYLDFNFYVTKFGNKLYLYAENDETREVFKPNSYHYKLEQTVFSGK